MTIILTNTPSIADHYLRELRDVDLQKDKRHFENNLERIGIIIGYELSKQLNYTKLATKTPLGTADTLIMKDSIVLCTILRAGLPLQNGIHKVLDTAALAFIGAGRKPENGGEVEIDLSYIAAPDLTDKTLVIADTMLASGNSLVDAYRALVQKNGIPSRVFIATVIASQAGVDYVSKNIPDVNLITCTVDAKLNERYYIVPGLGDAGDLLYGPKL